MISCLSPSEQTCKTNQGVRGYSGCKKLRGAFDTIPAFSPITIGLSNYTVNHSYLHFAFFRTVKFTRYNAIIIPQSTVATCEQLSTINNSVKPHKINSMNQQNNPVQSTITARGTSDKIIVTIIILHTLIYTIKYLSKKKRKPDCKSHFDK